MFILQMNHTSHMTSELLGNVHLEGKRCPVHPDSEHPASHNFNVLKCSLEKMLYNCCSIGCTSQSEEKSGVLLQDSIGKRKYRKKAIVDQCH